MLNEVSSPLVGDTMSVSQRSMSMSSSSSQEIVETTLSSSYDRVFPLVDEMSRVIPMNSTLALINIIVFALQVMICATFCYSSGVWDKDGTVGKIIRGILYIADFGLSKKDIFDKNVVQIICIVIGLGEMAFLMQMLAYYEITKTFSQLEVKAARIVFSFINNIFLIPSFFAFTYELENVLSTDWEINDMVLLVFMGLATISIAMIFYIDTVFRSSTCYLENTHFAQWDGTTFIDICYSTCFSILFSCILQHFRKWTNYALIGCVCAFALFCVIRLSYFPFISLRMNYVFIGLTVQVFISALISPFDFNNVAKILLSFLPFSIAWIICRIVVPMSRKKILEKRDMSNSGKTLRTIRIAIQDAPEEFVSWRYLREAISIQNQSTTVFVRVAQLISFFPSESQLLNHYISIISKHSDLKFEERFLYYQIKRIHILRQSSATRQSNFDFAEVQKVINKMSQSVSGFFLRALENTQELTIDALTGLYKADQVTYGICLEALDKYPNSSRLTYEYSNYLIDCKSEFQEGVQQFFKAEAIENGRNVAIDYAFRSMVNLFPAFIKKGILDYRGRNILNRRNIKGGSLSSSSSSAITGNFVDQFDEIDDEQAQRVFSKPKMRFALRRAINNISSWYLTQMKITSIVKAVAVVIISLIFLFASKLIFQSRTNTSKLIVSLSDIYETYVTGLLAIVRLWADKLEISPSNDFVNLTLGFNQTDETPLLDLDKDAFGIVKRSIAKGYKSIEEIGNNLADLSIDNPSLITLSIPFMVNGTAKYCNSKGIPTKSVEISQRSVITYLFTQMLIIEDYIDKPAEKWKESRPMCEICANLQETILTITEQTNNYVERENGLYQDSDNTLFYVMAIVPTCIAILLITPMIVFFCLFLNEVKDYFAKIMLTPKETFIEASKPISIKNKENGNIDVASVESISLPKVLLPLMTIIGSLIITSMFAWLFANFRIINTNYKLLSKWTQASSKRLPTVIQALGTAYLTAIFKSIGDTNYGTMKMASMFMALSMSEATNSHKYLTVTEDNNESINGFDKKIDSLTYDFSCENEVGETGIHANYNCLSTDLLMMSFSKFSSDLLIELQSSVTAKAFLHSPTFIHYQHMICYHLLPKLQTIHDEIVSHADGLLDALKLNVNITMLTTIVVALVLLPIELILEKTLQSSFDMFKVFIARFSPSHVIQNQGLLDLILGKAKYNHGQQLSSSHAVINSSPDAVFALSSEFTIELMNPAASTIFGYTPEQLLGQSLVTLIPESDNSGNAEIYNQAKLMQANQAAMMYSCQVTGIKDDGDEVSLKVILLGINHGQTFALICNDQTTMIKQQKQVEKAKESAEKLLNQILPPLIVKKMNAGETDISFTVQSSTIIFIDIARFSDYSATLTAGQIMQNLGRIFKAYDDLIPNYSTLLKIKLIGDDYMAAGGLFNPDVPPEKHATDVIDFALDALRALGDANEALEASLNVRIGVNTGGPLIAGVLGIDKPLFDIIGDPINVAARLQSTDIENHIQISQATYEIIKYKGYKVHERGKIYLKGKGEQTTYIIDPPENSKQQMSRNYLQAQYSGKDSDVSLDISVE